MKSWRNHWPALWLLLILALVAVVRVRLISLPLERDEGEYAYAGQLMLEGEPPYKLIYNMKMPGIYAAYALIMAVFGQNTMGIRLGFLLVNAGAIVLMYFVGRRLLGREGAIAASALYALLTLSPSVQGINAHATHFVVLAALGAILVLLRAQESGRLAAFFWSGALFGVAFLMKQPGGAFAMFGFSVVLWTAWRRQPPDWKTGGSRLAVYSLGVAVPIVLTGLILWRAGVWDKFWWWTVIYARVHATALSWGDGMTRLGNYVKGVRWDWSFWWLALGGWCCALVGKGRAGEKFFFTSFLFFSAAAVLPTLNFSGHYFVLMEPAVALLAARALTAAAAGLAAQPRAVLRGAPWILIGLAWAGVAWTHRVVFFEWGPEEAARRMYPENDFQVYPVIADYFRTHSPPTATFAVLGSEPELLFYAHRRSVTGYIYMYDLVGEQPFRKRMEKDMISEVEQGSPDFVVFVNLLFSWLPYPPQNLDAIKEWMIKYTDAYYEPYGVVTFPPSQNPPNQSSPNQYYMGPDCFQKIPPGHRFITIFQRKQPGSTSQLPKEPLEIRR
jgi:hypothetical protein